MNRKKVFTLTVILLAALICVSSPFTVVFAKDPKAAPIKIGAILPLTGPMANLGLDHKAGIELGFKMANWRVVGKPIELVIEDDGSVDVVKGLEKAKKLVEVDKVKIMLGPLHGGVSMAVEPYLSQVPVPSLSIEPQIAPITKFGWFFLTSGTVDGVSRPVGWYAAEELGAKTAITISRDDIPGRLFMNGWRRGFEEKGGKVIQEFWTPLLVSDFSSYLLAMKEADIVGVWAGTACETLLKQADEFGRLEKMRWILAHQGSLTEVTMQDVGKQLLKIKACGVVYSKLVDTPANKKYLAAAEESGTKTPSVYHEEGYEAANIALAALKATGGDTDPHKLRKAILGLKVDTPTGTVSYTQKGVAVRDLYIFNVKNVDGEYLWSPIKTYPQYTPEIILK